MCGTSDYSSALGVISANCGSLRKPEGIYYFWRLTNFYVLNGSVLTQHIIDFKIYKTGRPTFYMPTIGEEPDQAFDIVCPSQSGLFGSTL